MTVAVGWFTLRFAPPIGGLSCCLMLPVSAIVRSLSIKTWAAWISVEIFELESPQFTWTSTPTYFTTTPDMTSLAASGLLQNTAQKCVKRLRPGKSQITQPLFYILSSLFKLKSRPTYSTAAHDMTSSNTSGRHLSKLDKRSKMLPLMALGRILAVQHSYLAQPIGGFLIDVIGAT